jgi:hypothetical protein
MSNENTIMKKPKSAFLSDKSKCKRKLTTFLIPSDVSASIFNENEENINSSGNSSSNSSSSNFNSMQFDENNQNLNSAEKKALLAGISKSQRILESYDPFFNTDSHTTEERMQFQDNMEKNSYRFNYFSSKSLSGASAFTVPKSTETLNKLSNQKTFNSRLDSIIKTNQINYRNTTKNNAKQLQQQQQQPDELNTNGNSSLFPCLVKKPQLKRNDYVSRIVTSPTSFYSPKESVYFIHTYSYLDFNSN